MSNANVIIWLNVKNGLCDNDGGGGGGERNQTVHILTMSPPKLLFDAKWWKSNSFFIITSMAVHKPSQCSAASHFSSAQLTRCPWGDRWSTRRAGRAHFRTAGWCCSSRRICMVSATWPNHARTHDWCRRTNASLSHCETPFPPPESSQSSH